MATLKKVKVKRTDYSKIKNGADMWTYIDNAINTGTVAALFKDPNILAAFYALGIAARGALKAAMDAWVLAPTIGNMGVIRAKMALVVIWLNGYADQVETISNSDTNRTTVEEAAANILLAKLNYQQLTSGSKGKPAVVSFTIKKSGSDLLCEVTNGVDYKPTSSTFFAIELPVQPPSPAPAIPDPDVSLDGDQINVIFYAPGHIATQSSNGKSFITLLKSLKTGSRYAIYGFSQNGKKFISDLSAPIIVQM
jgi:hypothetical protein